MSAKKEYSILFLVIIGAGLYLYFNQADRLHYTLPEPMAVDRADIFGLTIERPGDEALVLEKKDRVWTILPAGHAADAEAVRSALESICDLTLTTLVSEAEDYRRYELDPDKALTVSALGADGAVLRRFKAGKNAPARGHTFVMVDHDPRVYQARGRLQQVFDKPVDSWRDKTVLAFAVDEIHRIDVVAGEAILSLVKREPAGEEAAGDVIWVDVDGRDPADQSAIKALLSSLSSLECRSFVSGVDSEALTEPLYHVTMTGVQPYTLKLFSPEDPESPDYWGISSQQADIFVLPSFTAERIMTAPDTLMGEKEAG